MEPRVLNPIQVKDVPVKKTNKSIYLRYEFSDEKGTLEGGDIFEFTSMDDIQEMASKILEVAYSDKVAVNLMIGEEKPFYGFLGNVGITREDAEKELVDRDEAPISSNKKSAPKKTSKKASKKAKKTSKKK